MVTVEFVNLDAGFVLTSEDDILPIEQMFDWEGNECGPDDAVAIVAGSEEFGWVSFGLGDDLGGVQ